MMFADYVGYPVAISRFDGSHFFGLLHAITKAGRFVVIVKPKDKRKKPNYYVFDKERITIYDKNKSNSR